MFGRLKKLFKKAEEEVEEKLEEKIEEAPAEEVEEVAVGPAEELTDEVREAIEEVKREEAAEKVKKVEAPKEVKKDGAVRKETEKEARKKPVEPVEEEPIEEIKEEPEEEEEVVAPIEEIEEEGEEIKKVKEEAIKEAKEEIKKEGEERVEKKIRVGFRAKLKTKLGAKAKLGESEIDDITWNLQMGLMESDVAMEVAEAISNELKEKLSTTEFKDPKGQVRRIFKETLVDVLEEGGKLNFFDYVKGHDKPVKIVFFGINGCGKTTTIAKIAHQLKQRGLSVVVAAGDTFRAGAQEQLGKHADRIGIKMVHHQRGGDAAAVVFDAVKHAEAKKKDVVLIDTAGRLHSDQNLVEEMKKIVRVSKPDLIIFVGESITGNDCTEQAQKFDEAVGIDGIILSKADVDEKGGAAISVSYVTKKPILYLGMGQEYPDLEPFDKEKLLASIF